MAQPMTSSRADLRSGRSREPVGDDRSSGCEARRSARRGLPAREYLSGVVNEDQRVLAFVGRDGKDVDELRAQFPGFDMTRLVRAGLVDLQAIDLESIELAETHAHAHLPSLSVEWYVLTRRGAEAIGIDPETLHAT